MIDFPFRQAEHRTVDVDILSTGEDGIESCSEFDQCPDSATDCDPPLVRLDQPFAREQFGVRAANYPLTEEDMSSRRLPPLLSGVKDKLFGLNIEPERLQQIRSERRPDSRYSSMAQCRREVQWAEELFKVHRIPYINTTVRSIEELAVGIMSRLGLQRRVY